MKLNSCLTGLAATLALFAATPSFATQFDEIGGWEKLHAISEAVLTNAQDDEELTPFFAGWETGSDNYANLANCLTNQLAMVLGSPDYTYPTTLKNGHKCEEMVPAHIGIGADNLTIGQSDYRKFISIAANTARDMGVNLSLLATIGDFLYGLEGEIVRHVED